jgi:diaminopimelate epimerase
MKIQFVKMHGAGNDYIYVDTNRFPITNPEELAVEWSRFHTGIGSDGLILIGNSDKADFSMRIFNSDGSEAMMCGNGCRCVGKFVYDNGLTDKTELTLDTLSGVKHLRLHVADGVVETVTVDMGTPSDIKTITFGDDFPFRSTQVSMGNPHLVTFVDDINEIDLPEVGPKLEHYPLFPDRTNVEFVQQIATGVLRMRVWERGSGITQACGTGACATAFAAIEAGLVERKCQVVMDGGSVIIEWLADTNHVLMTGPATTVFKGEIEV